MTLFGFLITVHGLTFVEVLALLGGLGFSGGFFVVPVNALIQHRPEENQKGGVIAFANFLSFVGVLAASGIYYVLTHFFNVSLATFFMWTAFASVSGISLGAMSHSPLTARPTRWQKTAP